MPPPSTEPRGERWEEWQRRARAFDCGADWDATQEEIMQREAELCLQRERERRWDSVFWAIATPILVAVCVGILWLGITIVHWLWSHPLF